MGLFDQVMGALDNPTQQANQNQLGGILGAVQQLSSGRGMDATTTQTLMSVVGRHVRTALKDKRAHQGPGQVEDLVNQYSGTQASTRAVESILSPDQQRSTVEDSARATGLDMNTIQSLLPVLIPVVLNFLQSGATTDRTKGTNTVLNQFLDSDADGDVDMGDAMSVASRFMRSR